MPRIKPVSGEKITTSVKKAFEEHVKNHQSRITNMKSTLAHSLTAFEIYMQWYPLYEEVKRILGNRLAYLFAWSISRASDCPLCTTYFRKTIIDAGENPEKLELSDHEQKVLEFGASISRQQGNIPDSTYNIIANHHTEKDMVLLIAFAGQMIATNIFSNVIQTDIDDYLADYLPFSKSGHQK